MARDAELDRLKTAQDLAFQRKQNAWQSSDQAWKRRSSAREALEKAFQEKQSAYSIQDASWQSYQQVRSCNGPRIDQLNSQQETAYQNMKRAFDNASSAHDRRDGAAASANAAEGHRYKAESQGYVTERRRLVEEIRSAKSRHESTKPAFQHAKDQFSKAKREHDQAKAEHERAQAEFKQAKADFDRAKTAFQNRLEAVKASNEHRNDEKRALAEKAGVPYQYRDNVYVSRQPDGIVNIYFGGVGSLDGLGHGHYAMASDGKVVYRREPFDPHGAQNFQHDERAERQMASLALNAWARQQTTKQEIQYEDADCAVKVRSGYSRDLDAITTDVIIAERNGANEHYHLVIDDRGSIVTSEWRPNHS